ncbi:zinc-binding dehydrogenase [Streptosporangium sp. H16]|uniref:zinc-binding dehydrogenase n=1 Tax=Streptosporangium sp. H16 TaxID=3444184 RepID=UPI003F795D2E
MLPAWRRSSTQRSSASRRIKHFVARAHSSRSLPRSPSIRGTRVVVQEIFADGGRLTELAALVDARVLTLRVARTLPLNDAPTAHALLEKGAFAAGSSSLREPATGRAEFDSRELGPRPDHSGWLGVPRPIS